MEKPRLRYVHGSSYWVEYDDCLTVSLYWLVARVNIDMGILS